MGLLWPECRTWHHSALLNLIQFALAHQSSLSRALCRAFLPSSRSTLPPTLVLSAVLISVLSIPSSRLLIKIINRTGLNTEPWGTPLVSDHQLDLTPFTTTLWAQPSKSVFYPAKYRPIQIKSIYFLQEDAVGNSVKGLVKVQVDNIHNLSLIHCVGCLVVEEDQVS